MSDLNFEKYQREQRFAAEDEKATASALEKAGAAKERWETGISTLKDEHDAETDEGIKKKLFDQMEEMKKKRTKQEENIK